MDPLEESYSAFECRVCESKDFLMNIFVNEEHKIAEKLCYCASIQISENDYLPQHICTKCYADLLIAYTFRKRCEETDAKLRTLMSLPVKIEMLETTVEPEGKVNAEVLADTDYSIDFKGCITTETNEKIDAFEIDDNEYILSETIDKNRGASIKGEQSSSENKNNKKYTCITCQEEFTKSTEYFQHVRTHGSKRFQCRTCLKWISRKKEWERHESAHLGTLKRLPCKLCSKDFSCRQALRRHIVQIHEERRMFMCPICGKSFTQKTHLQAHKTVHTGAQYKCSKCEATFKTRIFYLRHEQTHLLPEERNPKLMSKPKSKTYAVPKNKTYVCSFCGKVFNNLSSHILHERAHRGEKPYPCKVCGKAFLCKQMLKKHNLIHTGEKPHKCETCGKCFRSRTHLTTHHLTHTQEKKFACQICSKAFTLKSTLKSHMKCHSIFEENQQSSN
ncbi:zinc finger protein OZF-like isoform X3 [Aedes aegypti]|uniref:Uncharacterized protein n=1 Tax=Aedes aegypti TaxID=7159 RepID=A0A6I8T5Y7_AEDAE|nr:zinc finger protein OZF-like isoform X3 [Aedes aegypti]